MIYATCSLLKQESEDQVFRLLQREEGVSLECKPFLPGDIPAFDKAIDENGYIRVIPGALPHSLGHSGSSSPESGTVRWIFRRETCKDRLMVEL
jgi:hypothetical protein